MMYMVCIEKNKVQMYFMSYLQLISTTAAWWGGGGGRVGEACDDSSYWYMFHIMTGYEKKSYCDNGNVLMCTLLYCLYFIQNLNLRTELKN